MLGKAFDNEDHIIKKNGKTSSMFHLYLFPEMAAMYESVLRTCALLRYHVFFVFFFHRKMSVHVHGQRRSYV